MLSDALCEALQDIKHYEDDCPDRYSDWAEDIALVKHVMSALMNRLDQEPPDDTPLSLPKILDEREREVWRTTCEANIARWVERLKLLEPVSAGELAGKLHDAIQRQEMLLDEPDKNECNI